MSYVGAIDQGTTSTRFILFDKHGQKVASEQQKLNTITFTEPEKSGWAEQDPLLILSSVYACIAGVLSLNPSHYTSKSISSIGVTNQRESTVLWSRSTGRPLYNALLWHDTRTKPQVVRASSEVDDAKVNALVAAEAAEAKGRGEDATNVPKSQRGLDVLRPLTGLPLSTYFSAMKIAWLVNNSTQVQQAIENNDCMFGTIDSWLIWNLTGGVSGGVHMTDVSNASRTLMMSLATCRWLPADLLAQLGVPKQIILPKIVSSSQLYGVMSSVVSGSPLNGVRISGCIGDQQSSLLGQMCVRAGMAKNTYGTGCFLLMNTGENPIHSKKGLLTTVAFRLGEKGKTLYALEGAIPSAGSAMEWCQRVSLLPDIHLVDSVVSSVPNTGGVYFVTAFSGLLSPYYRDDARGTMCGINLATTKAHIVRAALESVSWQTRDVVDCMCEDAGLTQLTRALKVDGGLTRSDALCQMQANMLNVPVERPQNVEATALGAAFAAGLASGVSFWSSLDDIYRNIENSLSIKTFYPDKTYNDKIHHHDWKRAVSRSLGWIEAQPKSKL